MRRLRIGTWNVDGRWTGAHQQIMLTVDCDIWLMTEPPEDAGLDGYRQSSTVEPMQPGKRWAAVWSRRELEPLVPASATTAAARVDGLLVWASILPWRGAGGRFSGKGHAAWTRGVLSRLAENDETPIVWGGDWNHSLTGPEKVGSRAGRQAVLDAVDRYGLSVPTADLPHRKEGLTAIDHVAVPTSWSAVARHVPGIRDGLPLSDHDLYVADCVVP